MHLVHHKRDTTTAAGTIISTNAATRREGRGKVHSLFIVLKKQLKKFFMQSTSDDNLLWGTRKAGVTQELWIGRISTAAGVSVTHCDSSNQWRQNHSQSSAVQSATPAETAEDRVAVSTDWLSSCLQGALERPPPLLPHSSSLHHPQHQRCALHPSISPPSYPDSLHLLC